MKIARKVFEAESYQEAVCLHTLAYDSIRQGVVHFDNEYFVAWMVAHGYTEPTLLHYIASFIPEATLAAATYFHSNR